MWEASAFAGRAGLCVALTCFWTALNKHVLFALSMVVKVVLRLASEHCWRQIVRLKRLHQVCDFYMVKLAVASLCEIDQLARLHSMLAHSPLAIL